MTRRRKLFALGAGVAALTIAGLVAYAVAAWPWLTLPASEEEIDARYADVVAWAEPRDGAGDDSLLVEARRSMPDRTPPLPEVDAPRVDEAPVEIAAAIELLVLWHRRGGGLSACNHEVGLDVYRAGQWALATADEDDLEQVAAVARLATALRGTGYFVQAALGISLSEKVLHWSADRGLAEAPWLDELAPRSDEAFHAYARDAVCAVDDPELEASAAHAEAPLVLASLSPLARERTMLRWYYGDLLSRARPLRDDPERLSAFFDEEAERLRGDPPPSLVVRAMVFSPPLESWRRYERAWRAHEANGV